MHMESGVTRENRDAGRLRGGPAAFDRTTLMGIVEGAYADYYRTVYRYALALTRSASDAEDVTAETFERALRSWRAEPERVEGWLLLTARRVATDRWRRTRRLVAKLSLIRGEGRVSGGEERTEFWVWFDAVARILTLRQREVLVLRYQRDLTDYDIARIMGISESGVRSLVARALDVLRTHQELI